MVSYHGYFQYQNIIQAEPIQPKQVIRVDQDTIAGFLSTHKDYQLFFWMVKKAGMELRMGSEQFDCTLLAVNDENLRRQFGGDDVFINMDKHTAINILNAHLIKRKIYKKTLLNQRLTKIYTKNEKVELMLLNNNGTITINNMSTMSSEVVLKNGVIHLIDKLVF